MISSFDIEKLTSLLKDFYKLTQIRITVFNEYFQEIVAYPEESVSLCGLLRKNPQFLNECEQCDKKACALALKKNGTLVYECHAGLTEAITPIRLDNITLGYLFFGQVLSYSDHEIAWNTIRSKTAKYNCDNEGLKSACFKTPNVSKEYILAASNILKALANYLSIERMAVIKYDDLPIKISKYIHENLSGDLNVESICDLFKIGRTQLYSIIKANFNVGVAQFIRNIRIEKAKSLLQEYPEMPLRDIAALCGFRDYNYFITVFKRLTGFTPKKY